MAGGAVPPGVIGVVADPHEDQGLWMQGCSYLSIEDPICSVSLVKQPTGGSHYNVHPAIVYLYYNEHELLIWNTENSIQHCGFWHQYLLSRCMGLPVSFLNMSHCSCHSRYILTCKVCVSRSNKTISHITKNYHRNRETASMGYCHHSA